MNQEKYTDPALRQRLKDKLQKGDKGGSPGQWSARKSQMLASAYKKEGGGYRDDGKKSKPQKSLDSWTQEEWSTEDGSKARGQGNTKRYLPKEAWEQLSPAQKRKTSIKKEQGSKAGKQFVANTPPAKKARKKATVRKAKKTTSKKVGTRKKVGSRVTKKVRKASTKKATGKKAPSRKKTSAKKKIGARSGGKKKAAARPGKKSGQAAKRAGSRSKATSRRRS